jgi:hypothetical protein
MAMTSLVRQGPRRYRLLLARGGLIAGCALLAAACGSAAAPGSGPGAGSSSSARAAQASLEVTLAGPDTATKHWFLRCDPAGGSVPDAATVCNSLRADPSIMTQRRLPGIMCPMIMADGPNFTITGVYYGHAVHQVILRGGCDLARWTKLHDLFS